MKASISYGYRDGLFGFRGKRFAGEKLNKMMLVGYSVFDDLLCVGP